MAEGYQYEDLVWERQEIRLLILEPGNRGDDIACALVSACLSDPDVSFEALSYCWGDSRDRRQIFVGCAAMHITANLFSALQHLRHVSENRVLWVDAICINQEDVDEKTVQVALMGTIYSTCTRVLIWLGEAAQESGRALGGLADLALFYTMVLPGGFTEKAMRHLLERPWFDRVWIVQEMALPKKGTFICGDSTLDLDVLERSMIKADEVIAEGEGKMRSKHPDYFYRLSRHMRTRRATHLGEALGCPFPYVFERHSDAQATDPRDNVFAFVGLAEQVGVLDIVISYQLSVQQVYANLVKRWINRYLQLDIITVFLERQERRLLDLPSWIPDFSGRSAVDLLNTASTSPFEWDSFTAWAGRQRTDDILETSLRDGANQRWYIDRAQPEEGGDDEQSIVQHPHYSKFLALDGCLVDTISEAFDQKHETLDALKVLADPFLKPECEPEEEPDSDEEISILDVIQQKREVWDHVHTSLRPWTQIFSTMEPPDLDDAPYPATGETRFIAFLQTLTAGYSSYDDEGFVEFVQKYRALMYKDAKNNPLSEAMMNSGSHIDEQLMHTNPNSKINERLKGLLRKRRFAVTQTGFFALVPIQAAPGDIIAVLVGGAVPFVLRKKVLPNTSGENNQVNASPSGASATGNTDSKNTTPSDTSNEIELATAEVWHEMNGPKYAGTSRSPDSPLLVEQTLHPDETGETTLGFTARFKTPTKVVGIEDEVYDPAWQVIGTAYVHGIMHGEMKERYKAGDAALQTFLLV